MFPDRYSIKGMVICHFVAFGLLISWLAPATRVFWDALDHEVFVLLNGSLSEPSGWSMFWAILNFRGADLLPLIVLLPLLVVPGLVFEGRQVLPAVTALFALLLLFLVFRIVVDKTSDFAGWSGDSPSKIYLQEPERKPPGFEVVLLSEMYPGINPKDESNNSFPGDHAAVLILVVSFFFLAQINAWTVLAMLGGLFFMLPRLFSGAHWLTDDVIGGFLNAYLTLAWGFFTPWLYWATERLLPVSKKIMQLLFWNQGWLLVYREP
jgi:membrane-associated phospholipid phosphatase